MSKRVLVTYATKAGSTVEIAEAIGDVLTEAGMEVSVEEVNANTSSERYHAVVVGSAIRVGHWLPEAVNFVRKNKDNLEKKPLAYFTACMTLHEDTEENRAEVFAYIDPVREILEADVEAFFAGKVDVNKLSFPVKVLARSINAPQGDFRDWDAIREWAKALVPVLTGEAAE